MKQKTGKDSETKKDVVLTYERNFFHYRQILKDAEDGTEIPVYKSWHFGRCTFFNVRHLQWGIDLGGFEDSQETRG